MTPTTREKMPSHTPSSKGVKKNQKSRFESKFSTLWMTLRLSKTNGATVSTSERSVQKSE